MRLVCPNCDAQYEVDDGVIPEGGRDVQCSSCGHTWFQAGPDEETDEIAAPEAEKESEADDAADAMLDAPDPEPEPEPEPKADEPDKPEARGALDPSVLDVLREEAEHERRARAAERGNETFESQPNLGLEEVAGEAGAMRERMARLRGIDSDEAEAREDGTIPRSELLPDVEEINSTLRAASERHDDGIIPAQDPGDEDDSGFRRGFVTVLAIFALATGVYLYSARIAAMVPAAAPALSSYTQVVDAGRAKLNASLRGAIRAVTAKLSGGGG
ncbi:putative Zn finger-like uncharacterized protein [Rhodovulum iodosum]|uniref:Zn finger-like uncharacterized protein n=1 Tax=Rhodovulum iodosum TaxID=68291 RepID=A0ABV3XS02_9RHOB|nr:zinc-ribbon domain-containing protein [Rhodovulum robiginosum]RSK32738.1 hypothetical protein EJA01_10380 [Rhodovulum robiginosum]